MPENCNLKDCPLVPRVEALERANEEHGRFHDTLNKRIGDVEKENAVQNEHARNNGEKLDKIIAWQESQQNRLAKIDEIAELSRRLSTLEAKPGKRWEGIIDKAIWAVAAAVIAFLLAKVGL